MRNPIHTEILDKCKELHEKKSHDYAQDNNPFSNFEYAAKVAEPFTDPVDKVFVTMLAVKLARLAELRKGKEPKNESIEDTCIDFVNYAAIWGSRVIRGIRAKLNTTDLGELTVKTCNCGHGFKAHLRAKDNQLFVGSCFSDPSQCKCLEFTYRPLKNL